MSDEFGVNRSRVCAGDGRRFVCQSVDGFHTNFPHGTVEDVFVCYLGCCLVRIQEYDVAVLFIINKVLHHATKRRDADAAGDEYKLLSYILRQDEVSGYVRGRQSIVRSHIPECTLETAT